MTVPVVFIRGRSVPLEGVVLTGPLELGLEVDGGRLEGGEQGVHTTVELCISWLQPERWHDHHTDILLQIRKSASRQMQQMDAGVPLFVLME